MNKPLRVVMVGAGGVAHRHVSVLSGLDGVQVAAVADPDAEAAGRLAQLCGAGAFTSAAAALDAVRADAVYVCVPPFAHGPAERLVLDRGLPLFVEKPVALDVATADDIARRVAASGVVTGTGYHWRYLDVVERARTLLTDSPASLAAGYWLDKRPPVGWWAHLDRSGGQVVEQLTHVLDLARLLFGEATEVYAAGRRVGRTGAGGDPMSDVGDIDDATAATVRFASGTVATFAATSLLKAKHHAGLHAFGPGRVLEITETSLAVDEGTGPLVHEAVADAKVALDADFVAVVRGEREQTRAPYGQAVRSHHLACAVARSAAEGVPVRLPTYGRSG